MQHHPEGGRRRQHHPTSGRGRQQHQKKEEAKRHHPKEARKGEREKTPPTRRMQHRTTTVWERCAAQSSTANKTGGKETPLIGGKGGSTASRRRPSSPTQKGEGVNAAPTEGGEGKHHNKIPRKESSTPPKKDGNVGPPTAAPLASGQREKERNTNSKEEGDHHLNLP